MDRDVRPIKDSDYGLIRVVYNPCKNPNGRLFADTGYQGMDKGIRNFLLPNNATDIDIVRCAPSIFLSLAKRQSIKCPSIQRVYNQYDECLEQLHGDKQLLTSVFFLKKVENAPQWVLDVKDEVRTISTHYRQLRPDLWKMAEESKSNKRTRDGNPKPPHGSFMALLYQEYETLYMKAVDELGQKLGMWGETSTLMFDGILVVASDVIPIDIGLLQDHADHVTGLPLRLKIKEIMPILEFDINRPPKNIVIDDHHIGASRVLKILAKDRVCESADGLWALDKDRIWVDSASSALTVLREICLNANIKISNPSGKLRNFSHVFDNANSSAKASLDSLPHREGFARDVIYRDNRRLHFEDGYWQFTEEVDPSTGIYGHFVRGEFESVGRIRRPFPSRIQKDVQFVQVTFLNAAFDNAEERLQEVFLLGLARAVAGEQDKIIWIILGFRDSSKSVLFMLVDTALGMLASHIDAEHFSMKKTKNDPTRANQWALNVRGARVTIISESESGKANTMSGKGLKQFQSAKEGIEIRDLYTNKSRPVYPMTTPFMLVNNIPMTDPADALEQHGWVVTLKNRFVSKKEKAQHFHEAIYKERNPKVDDWVRETKYGDALLWILFESYRPWAPTPTEEMEIAMSHGVADTEEANVLRLINITGKESDTVKEADITRLIAASNSPIGLSTFSRKLEQLMSNYCSKNNMKIITPFFRPRDPITKEQIRTYRGVTLKSGQDLY